MGQRREARQRAVQFLFQHDLNPATNLDEALDRFWEAHRVGHLYNDLAPATWGESKLPPAPSTHETSLRVFADKLVRGVLQHQTAIDEMIMKFADNWRLERIAAVDRAILRLAIYEILHEHEIPPVVSINEAIEMAKMFSTEQSGRFVNGILDKVKGETFRPARTPL
jgi:N utilization substance protein B